ncbi:hypothetical protein [Streptomyces prasinopilosus]|uniref:hypothetical protein n=1 Tax=Streptomyces prasinopilosus TaxID=67344 RepID=UPI0006EB68E2|nr:hypothetical protein [Streptomyces prasinopilosus]
MAKYPDGDRRKAVCAWLTANGINPSDVPQDADMTIDDGPTGRVLRCEVFDRHPDGYIQVDERGEKAAIRVVSVPLTVEPPQWWQPHMKPTRDQLLAVLERVRELAPDLELEATLPGMHDAAREAKRDASSRIRDIIETGVPS